MKIFHYVKLLCNTAFFLLSIFTESTTDIDMLLQVWFQFRNYVSLACCDF